MEKVVMFAKAKILPIGSIRKHGGSLYKKTAQGWKRVKKKGHVAKDKPTVKKKHTASTGGSSITESHKHGAYVAIGNSIDYMGLKKTKESIQRGLEVNDYSTNAGAYVLNKFKLHVVNDIIKKGNKSLYKKKVDIAFKENAKVVAIARGEKKPQTTKKTIHQTQKVRVKSRVKPKTIKQPIEKKPISNDIYTRVLERQKKMDKKYVSLKGMKVKTLDGQKWEFQKTNDLGIPYFSKVKNNVTQKKQFTLAKYDKEWADKTLVTIKNKTKQPTEKKVTLRTITEQYQDKIKQLSIMNKPGRLIYKRMIQQAIKDKDKEQLKLIFKDIDNWLIRGKNFKKKKNIRRGR